MAAPLVTVAVVPRERFSLAQRSLACLLQNTDPATPLIYVDGGSPHPVRQYLERQAARRRFHLLSTERHVSPNVARNLAARLVRTRYVAFVDNDVLVSPDWLPALVECAEATGAWAVGPVICHGEPMATVVHSAGGTAQISEANGRRQLAVSEFGAGRPLDDLDARLRRETTQLLDFHALLVRMDVFDRLGPLDERLASAAQHLDLCLQIRGHGGQCFLEPGAVATYVAPPPFEESDLPYFRLRWCDAWNEASLERMREKWHLAPDDPALQSLAARLARHRRLTLEPYRRVLRLAGRGTADWVEQTVIGPLERVANRRQFPSWLYAPGGSIRAAG